MRSERISRPAATPPVAPRPALLRHDTVDHIAAPIRVKSRYHLSIESAAGAAVTAEGSQVAGAGDVLIERDIWFIGFLRARV
jgi:hypothetical protein